MPGGKPEDLPEDVEQSLVRMGLIAAGDPVKAEIMGGGVSSEIWKVTSPGRVFCVKRARERLDVKQDWFVPVERNRFERLWYARANRTIAGVAPRIHAFDDEAMLFAMEYFDPRRYRLWKSELASGRADPRFAHQVGTYLARIHAATAGDRNVAAEFATDELFWSLRIEPYLLTTAARHPALAERLAILADRTAETRLALVHGDFSPKNIFIGPAAPVFFDAECAWYGDPAFDLAFCLNHLLLKCMLVPGAQPALLESFESLATSYLGHVDWEAATLIETRAAKLLPALLLARVDGKSPVEYLKRAAEQEHVRRVAIALLTDSPDKLDDIASVWSRELARQ